MPDWGTIAKRIRVPLGFGFAGAYAWLAHPSWSSLLLGVCIALLGLAIRAIASGHVQKNEQLAISGPYAYTRNPLYLGSLIMALGFVIAARNLWIALIAAVIFFAIYLPVMRAEERFLRSRFPEFDDYCRNVPRLFPRFTPYRSSTNSFSRHLYWKHREYNAAIGSALMIAFLLIKLIWFAR